MSGERTHDEVVSELIGLQADRRGDRAVPTDPVTDPDALSVVEDDLQIRIAGITERVERLEQRLDGVDERITYRERPAGRRLAWRTLPEFNLCPPVFQLTLDDQIALLQTTIQTRLERES